MFGPMIIRAVETVLGTPTLQIAPTKRVCERGLWGR